MLPHFRGCEFGRAAAGLESTIVSPTTIVESGNTSTRKRRYLLIVGEVGGGLCEGGKARLIFRSLFLRARMYCDDSGLKPTSLW
jgi:hypothetical protein